MKPETRTFIRAFLDGFTAAGFFRKLEIPGATTHLFEPEPGEESVDREELDKGLRKIKERRERASSR